MEQGDPTQDEMMCFYKVLSLLALLVQKYEHRRVTGTKVRMLTRYWYKSTNTDTIPFSCTSRRSGAFMLTPPQTRYSYYLLYGYESTNTDAEDPFWRIHADAGASLYLSLKELVREATGADVC